MTTKIKLTDTSKNNELNAPTLNSIEKIITNTCFCKLRSFCPDKTSSNCLKHHNIYQEFMKNKLSIVEE